MVLKFDIEEPEERKKFIDSEAEREPPREANCWDVVAVVSGVLICVLIIFGVASLISFIGSLNEIEPEPDIIQPFDGCGPGDPVEWCPPPASGNSSNSTYTPPASSNSSNSTNSSNLTNLTVYNQTIDGNLTEYNQTIDGNLTEFD